MDSPGNTPASSVLQPDLQSSGMTASASGDESISGGWLSGIQADFQTIALSFKETAGGVANFVHRSAVAIADEIAQLEQDEMDKQHSDGSNNTDDAVEEHGGGPLPLPWEIRSSLDDDTPPVEDELLKEKMKVLAERDNVFLGPFDDTDEDDAEFLDEARIILIRRLLEVDDELARTHARLSGRSAIRETVFWKNYFFHVEQCRLAHLVLTGSQDSLVPVDDDDDEDEEEGDEAKASADDVPFDDSDSSTFVHVPAPPTSMNSIGVFSVDSMVLIDPVGSSSP
jgi:hypothetical protein